ncbi:MAG: hypothetical protein M5U26_25985 [Planctomycetota bacterium]|nr:hypothetical protein [Planctomycetota bacterium]
MNIPETAIRTGQESGARAEPTADQVLTLTDVARLLSCSVEDARAFLTRAQVPALCLPSGSHRFLASAVFEAIRRCMQPYQESPVRAEAPSSREVEVERAWTQWAQARGEEACRKLGRSWRSWLQLMLEANLTPERFFKLGLEDRKELLAGIRKATGSQPFDETGVFCAPGEEELATRATRVLRGGTMSRKLFE